MNTGNSTSSRRRDLSKTYKTATAVASAITLIVSAVILFTCSDASSSYFKDSPAVFILCTVIAANVLLAVSALFAFKGKVVETKPLGKAKQLYLLLCLAAISLYIYIGRQLAENGFTVWLTLIATTTCLAQIYFASEYFPEKKTLTLISGYFAVIFCVIVIAKLYLDLDVQMNAPIKLLTQFSAATMALSIISDLRILIGRCGAGQYWFSKILFITVSISCLISSLEEYIFNTELYSGDYLVLPIYLFTCAVFSAASLFKSRVSGEEAEDEEPTEASKETYDKDATERDGQ